MMRFARLVAVGVMLGGSLLSVQDVDAKARNAQAELRDIEAIVTHVDTSDNPGDTDMNMLLRPPTVDGAAAWYDQFWPYMDQEWIDDVLADVTKNAKYSDVCKSCAGTGPQGTACKVQEGVSYLHHPCPRLFACYACLDDIEKSTGVERANYTVKAEIFVNNPGEGWNDENDTFDRMKADLGFPKGTCDEWMNGTVCGKRVWVSGWANTDNSHDNRPELHPISSLIVDTGVTTSSGRVVTLASFIDGSTDSSFQYVPWMANYHELVPMAKEWHFDTSVAPFTQLFPSRPAGSPAPEVKINTLSSSELKSVTFGFADEHTCASPLKAQISALDVKIKAIVAEIEALQDERDHIGPDNKGGGGDKSSIARQIESLNAEKSPLMKQRSALYEKLAQCPKSKYRTADTVMNFDAMAGSYWVGQARLGWAAGMTVDLARFGHRAGYLSAGPPSATNLPQAPVRANTAALGLRQPAATSQCIVAPGTVKGPNVKHWFGWKVAVHQSFESKTANMTWQTPAGAVMSPQPGPTLSGTGTSELTLWVPAPTYDGEFKATAKMADGQAILGGDTFHNTAPRVSIDLRSPTIAVKPDGRFYSAKISATVMNMCGDASTLKFTWTKDGAAMPQWTGSGPFDVTLKSGEKAKYEVVVEDAFGVDKTANAQVIVAPELDVTAKTSCATSIKLDVPTPRGFTAPTFNAQNTLCSDLKVEGSASVVSGDLAWNETNTGRVTYKWSDLKIAVEADGWKWKPVPATWKVTYPDASGTNRELRIAPDAPVHFQYQVAVTGTDAYGRTATDQVKGDNDTTPVADMRMVLHKLWTTWRPGTPMPTEAAVHTSTDPLVRRVAALLGRISRAKPNDARTTAELRRALRQIRLFGFDVSGKARNIPYTLPARPVFATPRTRPTDVEGLNERARIDLRKRVTF